jgi:hypothetical protein
MTKIWLPDNLSDEAMSISIDLEYARSRFKLMMARIANLQGDLEQSTRMVSRLKGNIDMLKGMEVQIISMREFSRIKAELIRAESIQKKFQKEITSFRADMEAHKTHVGKLENDLKVARRKMKLIKNA